MIGDVLSTGADTPREGAVGPWEIREFDGKRDSNEGYWNSRKKNGRKEGQPQMQRVKQQAKVNAW
jgi:hypothetical protein